MLTIATSVKRVLEPEREAVAEKYKKLEDFLAFLESNDPDFIFLPAYYLAKEVNNEIKKGLKQKEALRVVYGRLGIAKENQRSIRIKKVSLKILSELRKST